MLVSIEFITTWHATNMVARRNERKKAKRLFISTDGVVIMMVLEVKKKYLKKENTKENGGCTF